jgi:nitrate reductase alpha subunit
MPNHEPRGCSRGASYSWYLYSASRIKYPMVRGRLVKAWREARKKLGPVEAWASIVGNPDIAKSYKSVRGRGGFVRSNWEEASEIIAAANVHTIKTWGPDRVVGFSPIPAMSMVSYASGARYLSLIGGTLLSFYDWYCDLPPSSPQTWGEQTDVPESADWYNSGYIIAWGSNVPQTRTPDAHFFVEARYNGTKIVAITPDYAEVAKFSDLWLHPKQGTDAAMAMAMGHVILREFFLDRKTPYFEDYCRRYTDMPMLVRLRRDGDRFVPDRYVRQSDLPGAPVSGRTAWKTVATAEDTGELVVPQGSIGYRWPAEGEQKGRWNLEAKDGESGADARLALTQIDRRDEAVAVALPYFGGKPHEYFRENDQGGDVLMRNVPARRVMLADGETYVATVFDLLCANYGLDRGLGGACAKDFDDNVPYTPAWQERITGIGADKVIAVARGFAENAEKTKGRSMVIIGAGMNHWYHQDMGYRSIINMLMMCGTVGVSGGGWAHYVGQEKLRPQTGWTMLTFALDWVRPPRHMNGTSFFYAHSDQWRYEKLDVADLLSPLADPAPYRGSMIDLNVKAERMGWLPSSPQLSVNPLTLAAEADRAGVAPKDYVVAGLKSGEIAMACEDPDNPTNFPRNLFIWRSNLFGSSGKGHEYFLRHFLGTRHGMQGKDLGEMGEAKPQDVTWRDPAPEGKLDLVTTLDFRMSTSCLYSDIVLPTATWYEKNDLNTSDMHPFIHPLSTAVDPVWESRSDWETYKTIAKRFSELAEGYLGVERDVVLTPIQHDTAAELAQPFDVQDWKKGECDLIPGVTAPQIAVVERDYPNTYRRFTALGPLADKLGNGGKGISWNTEDEVKGLGNLNYRVEEDGPTQGRPRIESDIDAAEVILYLAPETNGEVAVKAWQALGKVTGRDHTHLAETREDEKIRFRDIQAQPRKIISSPTWSGIESEHVSYTAGYTNVHELIPWRTLTGRQQFYQDHRWFRDFGEGFAVYRPPIDTRTVAGILGKRSNGETEIVLNFITPHQKWGIHSTYTDNLIMLTLSRGGPIVWISETDAKKAGIVDNDWIELFNLNGAIAARAVVSQRVQQGMCMMYHAQEKIVNVPGSQITGQRGGIHNSVTRTVLKPTHMVGGYAQLSYGFNYYGTVGSNRDEFVVLRKLNKVEWLDHSNPVDNAVQEVAP